MTEQIAEYGHFTKNMTQEELDKFHNNKNRLSELEIKQEIQKVFHDGGIEITLDEIFSK